MDVQSKEDDRMKMMYKHKRVFCLMSVILLVMVGLSACMSGPNEKEPALKQVFTDALPDTSRFIVAIEDEPDTVDFQCTTIYYTIAQNVFNRLVEMENDDQGGIELLPSLAESWEVSDDGRSYTFHLRKHVTFSNGSELTASDVHYTLIRLLTHPKACNQSVAQPILGADKLVKGEAKDLEGFRIIDDWNFVITLESPFEAFLACLSMPGASILDEQTTEAAGELFGLDPGWTIGTGSFILRSWEPGKGMILMANPKCWAGAPRCEGLDLRFMNESEAARLMFESEGLDVLDLDELGSSAEYFIHGDIYQDRIHQVQQMGTTYIALNESIEPLNDVRVRRALQLALNRPVLLEAAYSGRGRVEHGIYPHGLYGYNPELPEIPYDVDEAAKLLSQAGYADGFDMTFSVKASSTRWEMDLATMVVEMWERIGVKTHVDILSEEEFMALRKTGRLECYTATWIADYNDPDNFIDTFFGSKENTTYRSLCYADEDVMARVRSARTIADPETRIQEYRYLEQKIVQQDAAWIPLFSRLRYYVVSERLEGFRVSWNGSVKNNYRLMSVKK